MSKIRDVARGGIDALGLPGVLYVAFWSLAVYSALTSACRPRPQLRPAYGDVLPPRPPPPPPKPIPPPPPKPKPNDDCNSSHHTGR